MRSRMRFSRRVKMIFALMIVAMFAYTFGFSNGQASVYKKAQNDQKFYEQIWGNK